MRRGIRQSWPLSPYLFVLCIERLGHIINERVQNDRWRPIRVGRDGHMISQLMFADNLLLFAEASVEQMQVIKAAIEIFCNASGQNLSEEKTVLYFSRNVPKPTRQSICSGCAFTMTEDLGCYLGVPILHQRVSTRTYHRVVERVRSRLIGWLASILSWQGE